MIEIETRLRLDVSKARLSLSANNRGQVAFFLGSRSCVGQRAAGHQYRRYIGLDHQPFAKGFHHNHGVNGRATKATILLCERQAQPPKLSKMGPMLLAKTQLGSCQFLPLIKPVIVLNESLNTVLKQGLL